tara:strand:- start:65 stop:475 length:411 start_codon:yes stop_codon:yes gene_type:complete
MILKSNPEVAKKRIAICEGCKHFRKRSRTCGTPIIGNKIGSKRTCGCFMDAKVKLSFSMCPLSKWEGMQVSEIDYITIKKLLSDVSNIISGKQKILLFDMMRKYIGGNKKSSNCVPCIKTAMKEMEDIVREYESVN